MQSVNIHEAKTRLSQLIEAVESGEEIVIARAGRPVAKLVSVKRRPIKLGVLKKKLPERLLDEIARPLSAAQTREVFGGPLEPK